MIRICSALLAIGLATPASAQNVEGYLALARQYAAGDGEKAIAALTTWSRGDIGSAASVADQRASPRDLLAVAMLHTELANSIIDTDNETAQFHLNMAESVLTVAMNRFGQHRLALFVRRWYRFVASVYTSCELFPTANDLIGRGLDRFPDPPELFVARGVIVEVSVRKNLLPDWRRDNIYGAADRESIEKRLEQAETDFRRALALDGHNAEARLHLGWVRSFLGDAGARTDLDAAIADAQDDRLRYLAHLFLGGIAERQNHFDEARRQYDQARVAGPEYQTAYAALSRVEQALGHDSRARELALIGLQTDKRDEDDPWWDHRIGFDRDSLYWLRREVRRPQ